MHLGVMGGDGEGVTPGLLGYVFRVKTNCSVVGHSPGYLSECFVDAIHRWKKISTEGVQVRTFSKTNILYVVC